MTPYAAHGHLERLLEAAIRDHEGAQLTERGPSHHRATVTLSIVLLGTLNSPRLLPLTRRNPFATASISPMSGRNTSDCRRMRM